MVKELNTADDLQYQFVPVHSSEFQFKVRAASDAHLALSPGPSEGEPLLEVFIGGWGNTKSVIRRNRQKPDVVEVNTPGILNPGEFRGFWIRFLNGHITVGREGEPAPILEFQEPNPFPINFVGVCTGWGATGSWIIDGEVQIETPDKLTYNFHPVRNSGGSAIIEFKGNANCHIGLMSSQSENPPLVEIIIGGWENTASVIRVNRQEPDLVKKNTKGIVSPDRFTKFYLIWRNGNLTVRKDAHNGPIILEAHNIIGFPVNFIAVRTGWGSTGNWRITANESGPAALTQVTHAQQQQQQQNRQKGEAAGATQGWAPPPTGRGPGVWVPASGGQVPQEALFGGIDNGEQLFIARARHEGALIPGKLVPSHGVAYIAWGGGEHPCPEYEVLCAGSGQWVPVSGGDIPPQALPAGETEDGEPLFIGRANHNGSVTIGKVQPSHAACYIPYGGQELAFQEYEIFITN